MAGMPMKEVQKLVNHLEPQGVTSTRTKKGLLLRLPDNGTTMLHFSGSDVREQQAVRARIKRAGLTWPGEEVKLGPQITESKPRKSTLDRAEQALRGWEQASITGLQLRRLVGGEGDQQMTNSAAQRALYHLGWEPRGKSTARKWYRPTPELPETVTEPEQPAEAPAPTEAPQLMPTPRMQAAWARALAELGTPAELTVPDLQEARTGKPGTRTNTLSSTMRTELYGWLHSQGYERVGNARWRRAAAEPHTEPEEVSVLAEAELEAESMRAAEQQPEEQQPAEAPGREFLDTADSWTMSTEQLPDTLTLAELWVLLGALGLSGEVRVWRA